MIAVEVLPKPNCGQKNQSGEEAGCPESADADDESFMGAPSSMP
jgi:hypothetical protein